MISSAVLNIIIVAARIVLSEPTTTVSISTFISVYDDADDILADRARVSYLVNITGLIAIVTTRSTRFTSSPTAVRLIDTNSHDSARQYARLNTFACN